MQFYCFNKLYQGYHTTGAFCLYIPHWNKRISGRALFIFFPLWRGIGAAFLLSTCDDYDLSLVDLSRDRRSPTVVSMHFYHLWWRFYTRLGYINGDGWWTLTIFMNFLRSIHWFNHMDFLSLHFVFHHWCFYCEMYIYWLSHWILLAQLCCSCMNSHYSPRFSWIIFSSLEILKACLFKVSNKPRTSMEPVKTEYLKYILVWFSDLPSRMTGLEQAASLKTKSQRHAFIEWQVPFKIAFPVSLIMYIKNTCNVGCLHLALIIDFPFLPFVKCDDYWTN